MRGAIIIPVFQRTFSLNRLLNSLSSSDINENLFIVLSLDKFYNQEVLEIINDYKWHFGKKIIVCNNYKRGVDGNNLNCFFLGIDYDYFILLEDDCIVHPAFHQYIKDSLNFYSYNNHGISGFSLYRFERDELSLTPHRVPNNCNFTFFMQKASSRGSFYTKNQIQKFLQFLELRILAIDIPKQVQRWGNDNWEVIFMKYLVYSNQCIVPRFFKI